jgi:hypothetical protein
MERLVDKQVTHSLSRRILPFIVASQKPPPAWKRLADNFHFYATEIVSTLVGWGVITFPLAKLIAGNETEGAWTAASTLSVVVAAGWIAFLLWLKTSKLSHRLALHTACRGAFRALDDEMHEILRDRPEPQRPLVELGARITEAMKHHRDGFFVEQNGREILAEAKARASELVEEFKDGWEESLSAGPSTTPPAGRGPGDLPRGPANEPAADESGNVGRGLVPRPEGEPT